MELILASASPRRKEIIDMFNVTYNIKVPDVNEFIDCRFSPSVNAMHIAYLKAKDIVTHNKDSIVVSADTIVTIEDKIFGKPVDVNEAKEMLTQLSGKKHSVITGFCIVNYNKNIVYTDYIKTDVYFRELSNKQIIKYIETNEFKDKAGAYAIQGKAAIFIDKIEGDYFNVVGLPIAEINRVLIDFFSFNLI